MACGTWGMRTSVQGTPRFPASTATVEPGACALSSGHRLGGCTARPPPDPLHGTQGPPRLGTHTAVQRPDQVLREGCQQSAEVLEPGKVEVPGPGWTKCGLRVTRADVELDPSVAVPHHGPGRPGGQVPAAAGVLMAPSWPGSEHSSWVGLVARRFLKVCARGCCVKWGGRRPAGASTSTSRPLPSRGQWCSAWWPGSFAGPTWLRHSPGRC